MKGFIIGFLIAAVLVGGAWYFTSKTASSSTPQVVQKPIRYQCPMHPTVISDKPGNCPICGMKMVPMKEDQHAGPEMNTPSSTEPSPEGYAPVKVSEDKLQLMGVSTAEVREEDLDQSIRTSGRVVADETRTHHVHTKYEGYIEQIFVNFTGQFVNQGDPLYSIYSPELLATQREYLLALKAKESTNKSSSSLTGIDLLESARQRLSLWDIGPQQIAELEKTRQPLRAITIPSPVSGFVTAKTAIQGTRVMPSDVLYDIVDLSKVWILADVYEVSLPYVKVGAPVTVELPYDPSRTITGKVAYMDPVLDPVSRTVKARIEIPNPGTALKPEMFATVIFGGRRGRGLVVPESAIISTGERMIVFVDKGHGDFQPREVKVGERVRGFYEILSGLSAGDKVVVSGNFLLDSESKLRAAVSGATGQHQH